MKKIKDFRWNKVIIYNNFHAKSWTNKIDNIIYNISKSKSSMPMIEKENLNYVKRDTTSHILALKKMMSCLEWNKNVNLNRNNIFNHSLHVKFN